MTLLKNVALQSVALKSEQEYFRKLNPLFHVWLFCTIIIGVYN